MIDARSTNQKILLAFGTACSPWLIPTYESLRAEFDLVALTSNASVRSEIARRVTTSRDLLRVLPGKLRSYAENGIYRLWPDWEVIPRLERHLAGADLVHTVELNSGCSLQVAKRKRRFGYRHVVTVWENIALRQSSSRRVARLKAAVIRSADRFIAVSERARTALLLEGVPNEKIVVIGPGMVLPEPKERSLPSPGRFRLLFVAKKQRSKGVEDLLQALWLARQDPDLRHVIITLKFLGVEPSRGPYAHLIRRLRLEEALEDIPFVPHGEVMPHYEQADALVVPSRITPLWQEQWGMVFMEAMSLGLPVITTHSGSIAEVAADAALYAQPNDHHSLYLCIKQLVLDQSTWSRLSSAGPRVARARFDVNLVASRMASVYRDLLCGGEA